MERNDEWKVTALALGELDGKERTEMEARVAGSDELRREVDAVAAFGQVLAVELQAEPEAGLTKEQLRIVNRSAKEAGRRPGGKVAQRPMRKGLWVAVAASVVAALGAAIGAAPWLVGRSSVDSDQLADSRALRSEMEAHFREKTSRSSDIRQKAVYVTEEELSQLRGLGYVDASVQSPGWGFKAKPPAEEAPATEDYDYRADNPFRATGDEPLSTFSIDVDTASYTNVRRFLNEGRLPPPDAVRIEELLNYFRWNDPAPRGAEPFAAHVEVGSAPWRPEHRLVRIGIQGREIDWRQRQPSNLVFLIDVSGSMDSPDKLPLLVRGLALLVEQLDARDQVAIVVYAGAAGLVLPSTQASQQGAILAALEQLSAGGSTNGGQGIELAYSTARDHFVKGGINRVLLCTDGDFNVGVSDRGSLVRLIEDQAQSGVYLTVLGFGGGNLKDSQMEELAAHGNGNYAYVDSLLEARRVLVEQIGGTLVTIAKDVKVQVEFNPAEVAAWRLIGYENRLLAHQDFADDTKDAGEIGAGHSLTVLYELVPRGLETDVASSAPLRYRDEGAPTGASASGELFHLRLRYKEPGDGDTGDAASRLIEEPVFDGGATLAEASADLRFAAAVAGFGMLLRDSKDRGELTFELVLRLARDGIVWDEGGYRGEFAGLVERAWGLQQDLRGLGYLDQDPEDQR